MTSEALRHRDECRKLPSEHIIYPWPSLMKLFNPEPRPVTAALPPRAMVIAVNTALFPPGTKAVRQEVRFGKLFTHFRYDLRYLDSTVSAPVCVWNWTPTNDKVNLRTEVELEERVAHEVNHLNPFYDPHRCNTLAYAHQLRLPVPDIERMRRTPITLCFFTSSALSWIRCMKVSSCSRSNWSSASASMTLSTGSVSAASVSGTEVRCLLRCVDLGASSSESDWVVTRRFGAIA